MNQSNFHGNQHLQARAQDLVKQYGKGAVAVAQRKADAFTKDCREKDLALMLLSEVEKLAEKLS